MPELILYHKSYDNTYITCVIRGQKRRQQFSFYTLENPIPINSLQCNQNIHIPPKCHYYINMA